jgi:tetratricopeptide (TPR) repeat protein
MSEKLLASNPDYGQVARDVSVSLNKLGDFLARRGQPGDAEAALKHYTRSLEMSEKLLTANPDSAQAARDVSVSLKNLGNILIQRGQLGDAEAALKNYTRSLEIEQKLLAANPDSAQAKSGISWAWQCLGIALSKRNQTGDGEKVTQYFDWCVQIREALKISNPSSGSAASDLAEICMEYGNHAERSGKGDAQSWWKRAQNILTDKQEKGMSLSPDDRKFLETLRAKVGAK